MARSFDESSFRSVFMGDVLFTAASTVVSITHTVSGPTSYTWTETFYRGTWFSSPLALVQYMVEKWNEANPGGAMSARLVTDTAVDAYIGSSLIQTYARIEITPDTSLGTITALTFAIADSAIAYECGFTSTSQNFGAVSAAFNLTRGIYYSLIPTWPIHVYERGVEPLSGYAARAHDGTTYSYAGNWRSTVDLGVTLDRRGADYGEFQLWRGLWARRWAAGRAVTFYLDEADLPSEWDEDLTDADVLVVASTPDRLGGRRSVEWNDAHAELRDVYTFALYRPPYPDPLVYEVPSAIIRLSASVGEV